MLTSRAIEDIETLVGSRGRGRHKAAVRIEDIAALVELPAKLQSIKAAGATVTPAEYDAIVSDLQALHATLRSIAEGLQLRIQP